MTFAGKLFASLFTVSISMAFMSALLSASPRYVIAADIVVGAAIPFGVATVALGLFLTIRAIFTKQKADK